MDVSSSMQQIQQTQMRKMDGSGGGQGQGMGKISQLDTTNMSALEPAKTITQEEIYPDSSFTVYA